MVARESGRRTAVDRGVRGLGLLARYFVLAEIVDAGLLAVHSVPSEKNQSKRALGEYLEGGIYMGKIHLRALPLGIATLVLL
jgi:hypothetical protein